MSHTVHISNVTIGHATPHVIIAGPCVIEDESLLIDIAATLKDITTQLGFSLVFKSSYDKANRTSLGSYRGPGLLHGLKILERIRSRFNIPILADVHSIEEIKPAAEVLDIIQIPAFLCRQTDLIVAAAQTGKVVNIKKGQFLAPWDMKFAVEKVIAQGNHNIIITERGTMFGYNNLVVDFRSLMIMRTFGYPVIFDATHSVQVPGGGQGASSGHCEFIAPLACAAIAAGCDGIFMEVHPDPTNAPSDGQNMLPLEEVGLLLTRLKAIAAATHVGSE
ncbi:MAG: 3-deoxy-8-phosphooctulonate synthase [Nitrospiraceae bacterium]|nr:3-deoxy-8-phosphooctulonate synthase [Nitrospiraceae bacterium]|tara:strand:- start:2519 stop:3349 length:831 start_codon:yes stop_codon:yes gene_type:complete